MPNPPRTELLAEIERLKEWGQQAFRAGIQLGYTGHAQGEPLELDVSYPDLPPLGFIARAV